MKAPATQRDEVTLAAKPLAPEEVRVGDYVSVLDTVYECPSYLWGCDARLGAADEVVRLRMRPFRAQPPLKVEGVCVPFVYLADAHGRQRTLDLRAERLARIDRDCARGVWKRVKAAAKALRRDSKNKDSRKK
ncbi:hypothetical protein [Pseudobythopirellula maris]|uniref:hypothetical protein n=1 Tax=Pseudobythopirellula maris TaxID=2527991 RepID=UPI0011B6BA6C|nr:hypothetical protein [Pseudobythopirellula maris]